MAPSPPPAERGQAGFHLLGAGVVAALVFVLWLAMSGVGFVTSYCRPRDLTDGNSRSLRLAGTVVIVILAAVAFLWAAMARRRHFHSAAWFALALVTVIGGALWVWSLEPSQWCAF